MDWFCEPPHWNEQGDTLSVTTAPKTDFWRKTHSGYITDNGHFYYQQVSGDFSAEVKVSGQYNALYDQAGLMLRIDSETWIKCGIEYLEGVQHASTVVTRDFSDWSVVTLPQNPPSLWLRLTRTGDTIEIHFSLDGSQYTMLRQAYLPPVEMISVGMMCCAPIGDGFTVVFEGYRLNRP
jgi:regulation of enolase protein 1 (concanavalin A-like superfamily)